MKIALVQMAAEADSQRNLDKIYRFLAKAVTAKAEIICFPELSLGGYDLEVSPLSQEMDEANLKDIQRYAADKGITVLMGALERDKGSKYISQYVLGKDLDTYRKIHVGQREGKHVNSGDVIKVFKHGPLTFGIMLCYDGHFPDLVQIMAAKGAQLIFNPSASPNDPGRRVAMWDKYLTARAYDNRVWMAANNLRFRNKGGGMAVWNSDGDKVNAYDEDQDHMMVFDYMATPYSNSSMKKRDFKVDRREAVYNKYR